jgi:hypothetical protein
MKAGRFISVVQTENFARKYSIAALCGYAALLLAGPAEAQSLRGTAESIFTTIYGMVGVLGAISILVCAINWKTGNFLGAHDPKKMFITSMIGTALGFGVVSIVMFIKASVSSTTGISGV